jgi:GTPase SAR1 family protein
MVEDQKINLKILDRSSSEEYAYWLRRACPQTAFFLFCFSLVDPTSLQNVQNIWVPEVKKYCPTAPYILVGTKSDLRDEHTRDSDEYRSKGWELVAASKAEQVKNAIGAHAYIECSAKTQHNVKEVFEAAIQTYLHQSSA